MILLIRSSSIRLVLLQRLINIPYQRFEKPFSFFHASVVFYKYKDFRKVVRYEFVVAFILKEQ